MRILKNSSLLLIIDVQERLFPHMVEKDNLINHLGKLVEGISILRIPVVLTQQYTKGLGATIHELKELTASVQPIEKLSFSCCDEPLFLNELNKQHRQNIILCGIEAHVCVMQTAIDLKSKGYQPVIVEDAISSRKQKDKDIAVERMRQEGSIITTVESVLFELLRAAGNDMFKAISKLVK